MAGIQKVCLNNINTNISNALLIGIIIAKNSFRTVGSKKKNGELRGVMSFTLRDSTIDTINADVWGSECFVITFYERFLVGDVVAISSPKICIKSGENEMYKPQVTSPFYLSLSEGSSDMCIFDGDTITSYLPLLHIPTKPCAGYCGLSEILKFTEQTNNVYVDLLIVVKSVKPPKTIKTKAGTDMTVRTVEVMDNTTPASLTMDMFDIDTIQRAEEWRPLESVLFIADARVSWRSGAVRVQICSKSVITHQPHTPEAEALLLHIQNQSHARGGETAAWAAWSGERTNTASVSQIRDRLSYGNQFCAALHAMLTHIDLDDFVTSNDGNLEELRVRFADHTGELNAKIPVSVVEDAFGFSWGRHNMLQTCCHMIWLRTLRPAACLTSTYLSRFLRHLGKKEDGLFYLNEYHTVDQLTLVAFYNTSANQFKAMTADERAALRWKFLLEQCYTKVAVTPPRLIVVTLRRFSPADPIPLY